MNCYLSVATDIVFDMAYSSYGIADKCTIMYSFNALASFISKNITFIFFFYYLLI